MFWNSVHCREEKKKEGRETGRERMQMRIQIETTEKDEPNSEKVTT